jgi:hypothetical protein
MTDSARSSGAEEERVCNSCGASDDLVEKRLREMRWLVCRDETACWKRFCEREKERA